MKNLLIFYGSCRHKTQEEVSSEEWENAAESNYTIRCSDDSVRMVYVFPSKYFLCHECMEEEIYIDEFTTLRYFFNVVKFSSSQEERDKQTLILGKSMLPEFSNERIMKIAQDLRK